jgi:hypothetical protein
MLKGTHVETFYWWGRRNRHPLGKHKLGRQRLQERPILIESWRLWMEESPQAVCPCPQQEVGCATGEMVITTRQTENGMALLLGPHQCGGHLFQRALTDQFKCLQPKAPTSKPQNGPPAATTSTSYPTQVSIVALWLLNCQPQQCQPQCSSPRKESRTAKETLILQCRQNGSS